MVLEQHKALEFLNSPINKDKIKDAKDFESQLRVFTEEMSKQEVCKETYWASLQTTLKNRLRKKYNRVLEFANYPLPVVQFTDSVLNDFYRMFEGKNRYFNVDGDRKLDRLENWIYDNDIEHWIEKYGKEAFKNKPLSFVVIDSNEQGNPYPLFIDSSRLLDACFKPNSNELEYISFIHSIVLDELGNQIKRVSIYCEKYYRVFRQNNDGTYYLEPEIEVEHNIGYCPARPFIGESVNSVNPFKRRCAFSSALSKLEIWTTFDIFRNYVDHYAPFPVTESVKRKCNEDGCVNGFKETEIIQDGKALLTKVKCQKCSADDFDFIGPGTHVGIKLQGENNIPDGSGKFRMIFPDADKLKYTPEKLNELEYDIRRKVVGTEEQVSKEAVNEYQVEASFESQNSVLLRNKAMLDDLYKWIASTVAKLMYKNVVVKVDANFGTEFYLLSEDDLQARIKGAKSVGLPQEEIIALYRQLIQTKYKSNPSQADFELMVLDLDDFPMYTVNDCINFMNNRIVDEKGLRYKVNLAKYIRRFEQENGSIVEFGIVLPYWDRVKVIKDTLIKYNDEETNKFNADNPINQQQPQLQE